MIIANPLFDSVFRFLMEDLNIVKELVSLIIQEEILEVYPRPQEVVINKTGISEQNQMKELEKDLNKISNAIGAYRMDFIAIIKTQTGEIKKVLVELQRGKKQLMIPQFRRYLGKNYEMEDTFEINGKKEVKSLEIISLYILGFSLAEVSSAILKTVPCYIDVLTGEKVILEKEEEFLKLLHHTSYTIQVEKLSEEKRTRLERILDIFNQKYAIAERKEIVMDYTTKNEDPLAKKILERLIYAAADKELQAKMELESDIDSEYSFLKKVIEEGKKELEERNKVIEERDKVIEENKKELEERDKELEVNKKELEERDKELEVNKKELEEKDKEIERLKALLKNK